MLENHKTKFNTLITLTNIKNNFSKKELKQYFDV